MEIDPYFTKRSGSKRCSRTGHCLLLLQSERLAEAMRALGLPLASPLPRSDRRHKLQLLTGRVLLGERPGTTRSRKCEALAREPFCWFSAQRPWKEDLNKKCGSPESLNRLSDRVKRCLFMKHGIRKLVSTSLRSCEVSDKNQNPCLAEKRNFSTVFLKQAGETGAQLQTSWLSGYLSCHHNAHKTKGKQ